MKPTKYGIIKKGRKKRTDYNKHPFIKVGISEDISERLKQYNTIVPGLEAVRKIRVKKTFARKLEKAFKNYLDAFRIFDTECYRIKSIEAVFFLTRCYSSKGLALIDYHFRADKSLYYLDSIYFGKKIPLFFVEMNKFKESKGATHKLKGYMSYKPIKNWGREEALKYFGESHLDGIWNSETDDKYNFSNNILYHFMQEEGRKIANAIEEYNKERKFNLTSQEHDDDLEEYFSKAIFRVIKKYYQTYKNKKNVKKYFKKDFDFFDKRVESGVRLGERKPYIMARIRERSFYSFSFLYDKRGSPSRKKTDPYQFTTSKITYWKDFEVSNKNLLSLIRPEKRIIK